ncbi:hypothetical protein T01_7975 [Trichinella spiralis]|uniref:Uncharacterized protein n=1 Tax=Trichinella spiralis TaxID=6334 RepID=A0A0V1B7H9_TRISP|nr:hypothetical protein T01_7975 [Trichinella spiralis]
MHLFDPDHTISANWRFRSKCAILYYSNCSEPPSTKLCSITAIDPTGKPPCKTSSRLTMPVGTQWWLLSDVNANSDIHETIRKAKNCCIFLHSKNIRKIRLISDADVR